MVKAILVKQKEPFSVVFKSIAMKPIANPPFPIERMEELTEILHGEDKI